MFAFFSFGAQELIILAIVGGMFGVGIVVVVLVLAKNKDKDD